jgi:hypothetical protein
VNILTITAYLAGEEYYHYYGENLPEIIPDTDLLEKGLEEWWVYVEQGEIISFLKTVNGWKGFPDHEFPIALTAYTFLGHRNKGHSKKVIDAFLKGKSSFVFCGYNGHREWIKRFFEMFLERGWKPVEEIYGRNYLMEKQG